MWEKLTLQLRRSGSSVTSGSSERLNFKLEPPQLALMIMGGVACPSLIYSLSPCRGEQLNSKKRGLKNRVFFVFKF